MTYTSSLHLMADKTGLKSYNLHREFRCDFHVPPGRLQHSSIRGRIFPRNINIYDFFLDVNQAYILPGFRLKGIHQLKRIKL